ncbi:MAG: class I SAM-dependent methyltransferase [Gammaproteobacteria bacterium]
MPEPAISRTALVTSMMRDIHARFDPAPLIEDRWGERLVPADQWADLRAFLLRSLKTDAAGFDSPDAALGRAFLRNPSYAGTVMRARYTEDALRAAVARGVRQYVILGAGLDSFGLRRPEYAAGVQVIEIDHPATQAFKRERLNACGVEPPPSLAFVGADLGRESLGDVLARAPYRADAPAFFAWLGVTMYLTREANMATFAAIGAQSAAGSELVFSYTLASEIDPTRRTSVSGSVQAGVQALGEPWICGFEPAALAADLRPLGLSIVEDLDGEQLTERYCAQRQPRLRAFVTNHYARAEVAAAQVR